MGESQTEVSALWKHFKNNKIEHEKISDLLIAKYVELKTKPTSAILANLHVSTLLNKFLANNLHLDNNSSSFFQEEFQRLIKEPQDLVEKGDFAQAKRQVISALTFYSKNKKSIDEKRAWVGTTLAAKSFFYKGKDSDAIEIFTLARAIAPKEETSEATFYLLWPHLINKDYKAMKAVIDKQDLEKKFETFDSKVQYWIAYALLKTGDSKKATTYFNKIINSSPYSFYSIISLKEIAAQNKGMTEQEILAKLISKNSPAEFKLDVASNELKDALKRLAVWNALGQERFAVLELRHLQLMDKSVGLKDKEYAKTVTNNEYKEFIGSIIQSIPIEIDTASNQRSKKWLTNNGEVHVSEGELFDVLPYIPQTKKNEERIANINEQDMDRLEYWVMNNIGDGNRNNQLYNYACILIDSGADYSTIRDAVIALNSKIPDSLNTDELENTVLRSIATKML